MTEKEEGYKEGIQHALAVVELHKEYDSADLDYVLNTLRNILKQYE